MIQVRAMAARITCADDHAASTSLARQRGAVLDELLDVCAAVWGPDPVSYTGALTTIAPSEVGPKPARPIPVRLAGEQRPYFLAAERGRERPISISLVASASVTADRVEGENRQPF